MTWATPPARWLTRFSPTGQDVTTTGRRDCDTTVTKMYNAANCETLGITVPDDYEAIV